jgi:hypothetical protein
MALVAAVVLAGIVSGACGSESPRPLPGPDQPNGGAVPSNPPTAVSRPASDALAGFIEDCAANVNGWRRGEAVYPSTLRLDMDEATTYRAGVAIDGGADLQAQLPGSSSVAVDVRCGLGARLSSPDGSIEIDEADWMLQEFEEPGVVRWTWNVKAGEPGDHELLLELRPAVAVVDGGYVVPSASTGSSTTTAFTTAVHVEATFVERVSRWWDENWETIATVAAGVGAAVAGLVAWLRKMSGEVGRKPRVARANETPPDGATPDPPDGGDSGVRPPPARG